ncbi:MAG: head-tail connector protein [Flavobacteriaceae bacterium]
MRYSVTTEPANEPITLTEAKNHLKVDYSTDDDLITSLIKAARHEAERYGIAIVDQTITGNMDSFPIDGVIELPVCPVKSVTSVKYYDTDNVQQTLNSANYTLDNRSKLQRARIVLNQGESWPSTYSNANAIEVIFVAGFETTSAEYEAARTGIKLVLTSWYENRSDTVRKLPTASEYIFKGLAVYG